MAFTRQMRRKSIYDFLNTVDVVVYNTGNRK